MIKSHGVFWVAMAACLSIIAWCGTAMGQTWGEITDEERALAPPATYPEAPAVVIFDVADMELLRLAFMQRHVRIKVFKKDGADDAVTVEIPCFDGDKITDLEAQTFSPDGTTTKVAEFFTKKVEKHRVQTFTFPGVEDGAILEYRYQHNFDRSIIPWYFQNDVYTVRSRISISITSDGDFATLLSNILMEPVKEECWGGRGVKHTYEARNLMPAKDEPLMRAPDDCKASLAVFYAGFQWSDYGEFYEEWEKDFSRNQKLIKSVADSVCAGATTDDEKVERLFTFVHDHIVTSDDTDGESDAGEMLKRRRGDKGYKCNLLAVLLRSQDIPAHALMIGRRDQKGDFNPAIRSIGQLDYELCYVGSEDDGFPLDPAAEFIVYPHVPTFALTTTGLLMMGDSTRPITLDIPDWKSGTDVVATVWMQPDGSATCTTTVQAYGYTIERYREFLPDTVSSETIVKRFLCNTASAYTIVSASKSFDKDSGAFQFDMVLNFPQCGTVIDSNLFIAPYLHLVEENQFVSDRRFLPVDFYYPYLIRHRIRINLPENMSVADAPADVRKVISGAVFTRRILTEGNILDAWADLKIEKSLFAVQEYPDLKGLFDAMAAISADKVVAVVKPQTE
jgi:transglutaminase-like putative cysteine protease